MAEPETAGVKWADEWANVRDIVAAKMTTHDVTKAQHMAREWLAKHGKAE